MTKLKPALVEDQNVAGGQRKVWEKRPCPVEGCDTIITSHPGLFAAHLSKVHDIKSKEERSKLAAIKSETEEVLKNALPVTDPKLARDILQAKKIDDRRRAEAPKILAGEGATQDALTAWQQLAISSGSLDPMHEHGTFQEATKHAQHLAAGLIPVTLDGVHIQEGDVKYYKKSIERFHAEEIANGMASRDRVKGLLRNAEVHEEKKISDAVVSEPALV